MKVVNAHTGHILPMLNLLRTYHAQVLARYGLSWQDETVSRLLHYVVQVDNGIGVWVALDDGRVAGMAAAYTIPSMWDDSQLTARELFFIVAREAWGSTAAVRLEQAMVNWSRKENASPLFLFPSFWCERERVEELMQRGGYQHIGMMCVKEVRDGCGRSDGRECSNDGRCSDGRR